MVGDVPGSERTADTVTARLALRFTEFTTRWLPDAFGFALVGTLIIFVHPKDMGGMLVELMETPKEAHHG